MLRPDQKSYEVLDVKDCCEPDKETLLLDCGYKIYAVPDVRERLAPMIEEYQPDIIWMHFTDTISCLDIIQKFQIPSFFYFWDAEVEGEAITEMVAADLSFASMTQFLKEWYLDKAEIDSVVVNPIVDPEPKGKPSWPEGLITMINPVPEKGIDTLIEIAQKLPQEKFLVLESWPLSKGVISELKERLPANVICKRRVADMAPWYSQSKLHLVPSRWSEGFGMIVPEAHSFGIPVIASNRGGLPQAVHDGGIIVDDYENADDWVEIITALLNDQERYFDLSNKAYACIKRDLYDSFKNCEVLYNMMLSLIDQQ